MNILMLTNTFTPYVGGVARSVQRFVDEFRSQGHRVLVAAPRYKSMPESEFDVIRFPAIQHFNGTEFSLPIPTPGKLGKILIAFKPDIVHAHHPFALGGTAIRVSANFKIPLVFTHHTMYEKYTHYIPGDSPRIKRYVVSLVTGYCNYCDAVIAPSQTVAKILTKRGVHTPTSVIPTGVEIGDFRGGDGLSFRRQLGIPDDVFVVGHLGRLASEKNLEFLAESVARFMERRSDSYFLLVGVGPMQQIIRDVFESRSLSERLRSPGLLQRDQLAAAYNAMDVFAFASHTETQGMVLAEGMAAGVPVVALDASGVREVVVDGTNGKLVANNNSKAFADALGWVYALEPAQTASLIEGARATARHFDISAVAQQALNLYAELIDDIYVTQRREAAHLTGAQRSMKSEWQIASNIAKAFGRLVWPGSWREENPVELELSGSYSCND